MPFSEIARDSVVVALRWANTDAGRRVGEVVGRHVDGLDRGDRALARRGDPLLQLAHLGLQRRLVAHLRRHAAQERGDLRAGLHEAEDVVDEQQHVLAALVAEVLRHRQAGQRDAHARPGRLVHLAEDEHGLVDDAGLGHLEPEVVALARALAHAAERRQAAVLLGEVVDQLLDEHRLADAGAAEQADLAALGVGREQVDDLDAGLEHLGRRGQVLDRRGRAVDRPALLDLDRLALVDDVAEHVEDAAERHLADRDRDRAAGVLDLHAARQAVGGVHGDRADAVVAEVLLHLADEPLVAGRTPPRPRPSAAVAQLHADRVVDLGQLVGEDGLDDDALDLLDPADVRPGVGRGALRALGGAGFHGPWFSWDVRSSGQRLGAADDFHDLLRDLRLALAVHLQGEVVDDARRRSRTRCASRSCARRARRPSTPAARGRSRSRRSRARAARGSPSGSGS